MTISFRPLAKVKMMLEEAGHDVSYAYDDLVFAENTAFLFQFDDEKPENLKLFFNTEANLEDSLKIEEKLTLAAKKINFSILNAGSFAMKQKEDSEEIQLLFFPKKNKS